MQPRPKWRCSTIYVRGPVRYVPRVTAKLLALRAARDSITKRKKQPPASSAGIWAVPT